MRRVLEKEAEAVAKNARFAGACVPAKLSGDNAAASETPQVVARNCRRVVMPRL